MSKADATTYYEKEAQRNLTRPPLSERIRLGTLPVAPSEVDWAVHWLLQRPPENRRRCLDVGAGRLQLLLSLDGYFEERCGFDIASRPIWDDVPDIDLRVLNIDDGPLPYDDQFFDAVTMLMVLEHVFNPYHSIRELRRICKQDGVVIIAVPNLASIRNRIAIMRGRMPVTSAVFTFEQESWDGYHLHNFTQDSLSWLLRREGLEPEEWQGQGRFQAVRRLRPALFSGDLIVRCRISEPQPYLKPDFL